MTSKRRQCRGRRGRFVRNTPERVFGIHVDVCPHCRGLLTWGLEDPRPKTCHHCGFDVPVDSPSHQDVINQRRDVS